MKNKRHIEGRSPIPAPPACATLNAALLTSYRPVSPAFMLAEVLPVLLQLEREPSEDAAVNALFVSEAINALANVTGKITLITSASAGEAPLAGIPWLNTFISTRMTGCDVDSVQHAKLWLSHWSTPQGDLLQVTISSTNLTADAFHGQIQAGWSVTLPIGPLQPTGTAAHAALRSFLHDLGDAADCRAVTARFAALLARCPDVPGSHVIASVPGKPSPLPSLRSLAGGAGATRPRLRIMTPTLGLWHADDGAHLSDWCKAVGVPAANVELIWPGAGHAWVGASAPLDPGIWKMPAAVLPALRKAGVRLLGLPSTSAGPVFDGAEPADRRWSHAKFYEFNRGLLLGSHNWSKSAWGSRGTGSPDNFELSVFIEGRGLPISQALAPLKGDVALMSGAQRYDQGHWLRWAHAEWDGKQLRFAYRLKHGCAAVAEWNDGKRWRAFPPPKQCATGWRAAQPCAALAPGAVRLVCASEDDPEQVFPINDLRPGNAAPMGVDRDMQQLADDLLLESFGGPPPQPGNPPPPPPGKTSGKAATAGDADYTLEWLKTARKWRAVVDQWREKSRTQPPPMSFSQGTRLAAALGRRPGTDLGAAIAQEELAALLKVKGIAP